MARRRDTSIILCPMCQGAFEVPPKADKIKAFIACPHCRARLAVTLGVAGAQRAEWAKASGGHRGQT